MFTCNKSQGILVSNFYTSCLHVMIDKLRIAIPFKQQFVAGSLDKDGRAVGLVDLKLCAQRGARLESSDVSLNDSGVFEVNRLRSPYESLPSSWSTMAMKIFQGGENYWPHVEIKASPAKLLTGHNVYGTDDVRLSVESLITTFNLALPLMGEMLDFYSAELKQIDCTYSCHVESEQQARAVIFALRNISNGQTRPSRSGHDTTVYWGSSDGNKNGSRHKRLKAYLKHFELQHQIDDVRKMLAAEPDSERLQRQLNAMTNFEVMAFSENCVRFEASVFPRVLTRLGFPCRIGDFVAHCEELATRFNPIEFLWNECFKDIFATFEGKDVNVYNDDDVRDALRAQYVTYTPSGKASYAKADRLFRFVRSLKSEGFEEVRATTPKPTFYRNLSLVTDVIPKAYLINLQSNAQSNVVPLIRLVNVDFAKQLPSSWQEPQPLFKQLRNGLRLVS